MRGPRVTSDERRASAVIGNGGFARPLLDDTRIQELIALAKEASVKAYCPYSNFRVGAVAVSDSGAAFAACNVENASYGLSMCADRNAVWQMVAAGYRQLAAVVIYTPTSTPSAPCGACRQVMNEFGPDTLVICACDGPDVLTMRLTEMFPEAFGPRNLAGTHGINQ